MKILNVESELTRRIIFGLALATTVSFIFYSGPLEISILIFAVQLVCFNEVINLAYNANEIPSNAKFHLLSWYLLFSANLYICSENLMKHFDVYIEKYYLLHVIFYYHKFIAFCLYFSGMIWFIFNIMRKYSVQQYGLLCWTHMLIFVVCCTTNILISTLFYGLIWILLIVSLVVCNDIFAYVFGKIYGNLPLIKVSPKKTWEGYIGGAVCTVIFGCIATYVMCNFNYFICPMKYINTDGRITLTNNCTLDYKFQLQPYEFNLLSFDLVVKFYPYMFDTLILSLFASFIAPFGGFFASGIKRALKVKDFSNAIPGHGGFTDRIDCMIIMIPFVYVYIITFFQSSDVKNIFDRILYLDDKSQLEFYRILEKALVQENTINQ